MTKLLRAPLIAGLVLACAGPTTDVTLGAAGPWTEGYGAMNKRGIDLAIEEINTVGGVRGRPLRLIARDDGADGAKAASIALEFVQNPAISAVVGHVNSGTMVAAAGIYDGALPAVATTATSPDLSGISPWVFRVIASDSATGAELGQFARRLGHGRAAILYENDSYGRGLADAFRRSFDGTIVSIDPIPSGEADFEPYIAFLKAKDPGLVFVAGTEASGMAILREARRQELSANFLGGDGWTGIVGEPAAQGAYVGAPFTAADDRQEAQRFVTAFRARFDMTPDGNAALAYDATKLLAKVINDVGPDRAAIRDRLASLTDRSAYRGVTGAIRFHANGDPIGKTVVIAKVNRGELVLAGSR
jgi:branched-chain amino acid transport system substrate-binding protein